MTLKDPVLFRVWVFRSWGRVGTTIGSTKLEEFETEEEAIEQFQSLYEQKTGNSFHHRDHFQKLPGKYYPLEIDFGHVSVKLYTSVPFSCALINLNLNVTHFLAEQEAEEVKKLSIQMSTSKLPKSIQELICLLFDVDNMKKALLEFEVVIYQQFLLIAFEICTCRKFACLYAGLKMEATDTKKERNVLLSKQPSDSTARNF